MLKNSNELLVLGGSGFIGQKVIERALLRKYKITVISKKKKLEYKKVKYIYLDLRNYNNLSKKLVQRKFQYIINLSGNIDHSKFDENGKDIIENHFNVLVNVLSIININTLKKIIQIGTSDEYGAIKSPQKEVDIKVFHSVYSFAKNTTYNFLLMLNKIHKINFTYIRPYLVYGPNQKDDRLIPYVVKSCLNNNNILLSNPNYIRDFVYVDDFAELIVKVLKNSKSNQKIYNLGSGKPISIKKITEKIIAKIGRGRIIHKKLYKLKKENKSLYANISKAKNDLNWKPLTSIDEGLDKTIKYYKNIYGNL